MSQDRCWLWTEGCSSSCSDDERLTVGSEFLTEREHHISETQLYQTQVVPYICQRVTVLCLSAESQSALGGCGLACVTGGHRD